MSNVWGKNIQLSIFGESHGPGIGVVLGHLPDGEAIDLQEVARQMARRAPGGKGWSTPRSEGDQVEVLSGLYQGATSGAPLCGLIRNANTRSGDYANLKTHPRPGHADYAGQVRYHGHNDPRGGGHFSGRLTAPLVFAGAVAQQILARRGVYVGAHVARAGEIPDAPFDPLDPDPAPLLAMTGRLFPAQDEAAAREMIAAIEAARMAQDSLGGQIEVKAVGVPAGLGDPFFRSFESVFASLAYAIPAVKAVAFGAGEDFARMRGSDANDPFALREGRVVTQTNHTGGINGGITNGMPVLARLTFRPTPSISQPQRTVDLASMREDPLVVKGRHDPCILPRAVPVVEAAMALTILDFLGEAW
ncbi:MAG: chorismate synthase [Christensenellales bacterium]|jgi:chorismate synthase